jgi:seryl-tRNA synthetase
MLDAGLFKNDEGLELVRRNLKRRNENGESFNKLVTLSEKRKSLIISSEELQNRRNTISKEIGLLNDKTGDDANKLKDEVKQIGESLKAFKEELAIVEAEYEDLMMVLPNILDTTVPDGVDESSNIVVAEYGKKPAFDFEVKPHFEIAEDLDLVDFKRGVKLSGSRFYVYNDEISRLERKLTDFLLKIHETKGYKERTVPFLVTDQSMYGTGQFPKFAGEYYRFEADGLNLIPTAEVPLTNLYADEILPAEELPIYITSATPCFRREAGSAGKDTRGLIRVHQFYKVELVKFVSPESSTEEHEKLTADAEFVLEKMNLHYRRLLLCSGDTSFSSAKTYDLEIWMPGMNRWMEISSCSNFRDFQARRAKIRVKNPESGKNEFVHTLNGSGVALGRLIAALLEYNQTADGNVDFEKIYSLIS